MLDDHAADHDQTPGKPRSPLSRLLSGLDRWASRPELAAVVLTAVVAWVGFSIATGFPSRLETVFQTLVAALTLAMVFVIQHTQARQQAATQRKLDEILQALPGADNALLALEQASDGALRAAADSHTALRAQALDADRPPARPRAREQSADDISREQRSP